MTKARTSDVSSVFSILMEKSSSDVDREEQKTHGSARLDFGRGREAAEVPIGSDRLDFGKARNIEGYDGQDRMDLERLYILLDPHKHMWPDAGTW